VSGAHRRSTRASCGIRTTRTRRPGWDRSFEAAQKSWPVGGTTGVRWLPLHREPRPEPADAARRVTRCSHGKPDRPVRGDDHDRRGFARSPRGAVTGGAAVAVRNRSPRLAGALGGRTMRRHASVLCPCEFASMPSMTKLRRHFVLGPATMRAGEMTNVRGVLLEWVNGWAGRNGR
jgi:hypothetical protein